MVLALVCDVMYSYVITHAGNSNKTKYANKLLQCLILCVTLWREFHICQSSSHFVRRSARNHGKKKNRAHETRFDE